MFLATFKKLPSVLLILWPYNKMPWSIMVLNYYNSKINYIFYRLYIGRPYIVIILLNYVINVSY